MLFKREEVMQRVEEVPAWIKAGVIVLTFTYIFATSAIQYIYGCVVSTLATIESDSTTAVLCTPPSDDPDAPLPPYSDKEEDVKEPLIQQEVLLIKNKPITASLRGTVRHLRSRGASPLRGAGIGLLYFFLLHLITNLIGSLSSMSIAWRIFSMIVAQLGLVRVAMLWTHIIISEPSPKRFYQRFVPRSVAKKVMLPTLATTLAHIATPLIPALTWTAIGGGRLMEVPVDEQTPAQRARFAAEILVTMISGLAYFCVVAVPISIALVRVYAAQLPAEETPIVPFDRTFGGLVVSEAEGGRGKLMLKDAWKSFDWNGRVRLIKVWVKMTVMLCFTTIFFLIGFGFLGTFGYGAIVNKQVTTMHA